MLQWTWSHHDVLAVANLVLLGSTYQAAAMQGNEPLFTTSFAVGVAMRVLLHNAFGSSAPHINALIKHFRVVIDPAEESLTSSGGGVGDCGGGPFRIVSAAEFTLAVSLVFKVFLLVLPVLYTLQWGYRLWHLRQQQKDRTEQSKDVRSAYIRRTVLFLGGAFQALL